MRIKGNSAAGRGRVQALLLATAATALPAWAGPAYAQSADGETEAGDTPESPTIIVTGSRISRADVEAPVPTKVLDSAEIEQRGATSIGEFLSEIPSFRNTQGPQTATSSTLGTGQFSPDLRALGVIRTLTLVDNRRFVPSSAYGQVDLNLIPQILVDRIDVVTGGASAAYGSDAVSGVVNVILDKRLDGFKGDMSMGISAYGDGREFRGALAWGSSFAGDRGHIVLGGEYVDSAGVEDVSARPAWSSQPALVSYTGARAAGVPSRAYLTGAQLINMSYGGLITGVNADTSAANGIDVLRGIQFGLGGMPTAFNYGNFAEYGSANTTSTGFTGGNPRLFLHDGHNIIVPTERYALFGHVDFEAGEGLDLFLEGSYSQSSGYGSSPPVRDTGATARTIRRDNAYLPSSVRDLMIANGITSFTLSRAYNDLGPVARDNSNTTERIAAGFDYAFTDGWSLNGYYQYGRNVFDGNVHNLRVTSRFLFALDAVQVGSQIVCAATQPNGTVTSRGEVLNRFNAAASGCVPINVFGAGSPGAEAIDYVTETLHQRTTVKQQVASLGIQGQLFDLPGGALAVAFGGEWRKEEAVSVVDAFSASNDFAYSNPKAFAGSYEVKEAFAEIVAPLLKDRPFADLLEINGAIRYTDYSISGGVTTWKIGAIYAPVPDLRIRATRSRDIRAPNNQELFATTRTIGTFTNPFAGNASSQITQINAPSPTLRPEKANTWTVGAALTPGFVPGLTLSADYYDIDLEGAIATFPAQNVLENCFAEVSAGTPGFYCQFVDRTGSGTTATVNTITAALLNIGSIRTRGVDLAATYRKRIGEGNLTLRAVAAYVKDLIYDDGLGRPATFNAAGGITNYGSVVQRAGSVGGFTNGQQTNATGTPHWTATGSITWSKDPVTLNLQGRYVGGGMLDPQLVGPEDDHYDPASPISIASNRVDSRFYLDASMQFDVIKDGNRKFQFYLGVNNITNKDAPFPVIGIAGMYDRMGRYYRAGIRFSY